MAKPVKRQAVAVTYVIAEDGCSILCVRCGLRSHNENDVMHRFCGKCGWHDLRVNDGVRETITAMLARALTLMKTNGAMGRAKPLVQEAHDLIEGELVLESMTPKKETKRARP